MIPIGVVTVSDRASAGVYEDKGGPGIEAALAAILATPWRAVRRVIPDERAVIEATLIELADIERCSLILTTGGTGPAPRDVTPEATEAVASRLMPGFGELMRARSLLEVPTAILRANGGATRAQSHRQFAGQALGDPHLLGCGVPRHPLLSRSPRRRPSRNRP